MKWIHLASAGVALPTVVVVWLVLVQLPSRDLPAVALAIFSVFAIMLLIAVDGLVSELRRLNERMQPQQQAAPPGMRAIFVPARLGHERIRILEQAGKDMADELVADDGLDSLARELKKGS